MSRVDELLKEYIQSEFSHRLNMYLAFREVRKEVSEFGHLPQQETRAFNPVQKFFESLKTYLPDFSAFKKRRTIRTTITG